MAIQSASAKLYLGIKLMCVDKNAQATLISSFTVGNIDKDFPNDVPDVDVNSNFTFNGVNNVKIYSGIYPWKIKRAVADLVVTPQTALIQERYKTYGFGNNVITEGSPRVIDNTNNWKVTSSLVCEFPTYIEIDVGKLQLPEGTTVTLNFEEGWIVEDRGNLLASGGYEYPNAVQGAPSPRKDNYITFRTPWYGLSFMNSQFSVPNTVLRIKQLQASILSEGSITRAYPIYNPGNFAALFGGVFLTTPNASKKVVTGSVMSSVFGPAIFNFPYRLRLFQSDFAPATFTQPDTNGTRVRFASSTMESLFAMNASPVKDVSINLTAFNNVAMTTTAVKKVSPVQVLNVISSIVASQEITRRASSNISSLFGTTANVSYRVSPVVPQFAVISTMVPSFDTIMEYNTAVYTTTYTGYGSQQRYIAFAINGRSTPLTILWGDGSQDTYGTADGYVTHTYASNGIYNIRIRGRFTHLGETDEQASVDGSNPSGLAFRLQGYNSKSQITKVKAFGEHGLTNLNYAFGSCVKLTTVPATMVDANITTMKYCFGECRLFNSNISAWPVNLSGEFALWNTFSRCQSFNQPLNNWDISNVTGLYATFANSGFNQPLNNWDTRNVTTMYFLFYNTGFNQNISSWNTSQVNNMNSMFGNNGSFDQNISNWCVTLIPTKPSGFDQFTNANWTTAEKPVWGTCP